MQKVLSLLLTLLALVASTSFAQTTNVKPITVIDGSKTPDLIPDAVAYRMVFLSLSTSLVPTEAELRVQDAKLRHLGFTADERASLLLVLRDFRTRYDDLKAKQKARGELPSGAPGRKGNNRPEKNGIVESTRGRFAAVLGAEHLASFNQFVRDQ